MTRRRMTRMARRSVAVALVATTASFAGIGCVTRAGAGAVVSAAAAGVSGGLVQVALFTLAEILQMRRELASAEGLAGQRRVASEQASARASAAALARSADSRRLAAAAANASAAAAHADAALATVEAELAERLGLTAVPAAQRAAAIRARLAEGRARPLSLRFPVGSRARTRWRRTRSTTRSGTRTS